MAKLILNKREVYQLSIIVDAEIQKYAHDKQALVEKELMTANEYHAYMLSLNKIFSKLIN